MICCDGGKEEKRSVKPSDQCVEEEEAPLESIGREANNETKTQDRMSGWRVDVGCGMWVDGGGIKAGRGGGKCVRRASGRVERARGTKVFKGDFI